MPALPSASLTNGLLGILWKLQLIHANGSQSFGPVLQDLDLISLSMTATVLRKENSFLTVALADSSSRL